MTNEDGFMELMAGLGELFDKPMSPSLVDIYWNALTKYTDEEVRAAFTTAGLTCKWFPKPVELIELIDGNPEDRIAMAWTQLRDACESVGAYSSVSFDDPGLIAVIEDWGGWQDVCHLPYEEWQFRQKQFRDIYRANMRSPRNRQVFTGIHDASNRTTGHLDQIDEPVQIQTGRRQKHLQLIKGKEDQP